MEARHFRNDLRIMVWAGKWKSQLNKSVLFDANATDQSYLRMLQTLMKCMGDVQLQ